MATFVEAITTMTTATFSVATSFASWVMETPIVLCGVAISVIGFGIGKAMDAIRGV